jgi:hypothetical protein
MGISGSISSDFEVDLCVCGNIGVFERGGTTGPSIGKIFLKGFQEGRGMIYQASIIQAGQRAV